MNGIGTWIKWLFFLRKYHEINTKSKATSKEKCTQFWHHFHKQFNVPFQMVLQSTLGFATLDKAAALGLATATPLTDLRQYINSNLGFSNLKIWLLYSKIAAVVVAKPSGHKNKNGNNSEAKKWLNNMYFLKTLLVIKISYSSSTIE